MFRKFANEYRAFFLASIISTAFAIAYNFIPDLVEKNKYVAEILLFIDTIAIAVFTNCMFCYFQVFLPEQTKKKRLCDKLKSELNAIYYLSTAPVRTQYDKKWNGKKEITEMTSTELKEVFNSVEWKTVVPDPVPGMRTPTYADFAMNSIGQANEKINKVIVRYYNYLEPELLNILYNIQDSAYFNMIITAFPLLREVGAKNTIQFNSNAFGLETFQGYCKKLKREIEKLK